MLEDSINVRKMCVCSSHKQSKIQEQSIKEVSEEVTFSEDYGMVELVVVRA